MGQIYTVGNEYISKECLDDEIENILSLLKNKKRTYSMNTFILKSTISVLEKEVEEIANTKIFQ